MIMPDRSDTPTPKREAHPTARQALELARLVDEARDLYGVEVRPWSALSTWWHTKWHDESRPGRGSDMDTIALDGDYVVYIQVDVYGSGSLSIASLDWVHSDDNEECDCKYCVSERTESDL